jgi:protein-S-isoprenylcysteine O-methyltransferase Ste14
MESPPRRGLLGPLFGTIVFTLVVPGSVVVLVPYALTRWELRAPLLGWPAIRWAGLLLIGIGAPFFIDFLARFVREGRGTPAPIAPTEKLVVGGTFRFVRNPGYLSVLAMITGQGLFLGSGSVLIYATVVAAIFHLFVVFYEEPTLRRQFGESYGRYCHRVPRWLPRRPRDETDG